MKKFISPLFMLLMISLSACSSQPRKQERAQTFTGGRTVAWQNPNVRKPRKSARVANREYKRRLRVADTRNEAFRPVW